ncbi:MAG: beta-lactamase family protein [Alphaproteobacteria bacterium]|nr:beta-lactamase family protein [Alphaproteobacteria bacterium]MBU1513353.1 beta-lactamase family protein [Alphaproteobacteria bacterium]MBU2096345.1 beta-lactamase family protein [Alphaproteobacteria bacterium]MBU2149963.1 beta-lactamase family protein [Alphaproteobacteria bacterium]MBU2309839.1 beta-lactamase family protein [Alphaproteobacteria bacterium]
MGPLKRLAALALAASLATPAMGQTQTQKQAFAAIDPLFATYMAERHAPGLVYGVVVDGKLAYVRTFGIQDTATKTPVTADTVFRIASMSKNFTALAALKLRDEGKLAFDAPAETVIPELKGLKYPTTDSPKITVRDLLTHSAGFVTDDPWGDRQLPMREADFTAFVAAGVPFSRAPGMAFEYSNFGYALVGRTVTNTSGKNYADYIDGAFLKPLGMASTGYDLAQAPKGRLALGYRWQDAKWVEEPTLGPGAFGAMGGLMTTANDYARYMAWELAAWPPRDGPEDGILKRSSIREIVRGQNFASVVSRTDRADPTGCDRARTYGMGTIAYADCVLGPHFTHSGGLPGYGSNVLMLPERGVGVFAFSNLTYAPVSLVVRDAAIKLVSSGAFPVRATPPSAAMQAMAATVQRMYAAGDVLAVREALAMNVLLDRDAPRRNAEIAALKAKLGACRAADPIVADNAMSGVLSYPCERGTLKVRVTLAPTTPESLQTVEFSS